MKDAVKYLKILLSAIFLTTSFIVVSFVCIICYPQDVFATNYNNVLRAKYNNLVACESPKIIIVGGSSSAFGIAEDLLEEKTEWKVVNTAVHAGVGPLFETEIAKANINSGDIVLLGYEYNWGKEDAFQKLGVDIVMTGIDSQIEMYRHIPFENWKEVFGYLFVFAEKKMDYRYKDAPVGTYSRNSFDDRGRMILERPEFILQNYEENVSMWGEITDKDLQISDESIEYLKDFKRYVQEKGAKVYFISPPLLKKAFRAKEEELNIMIQTIEQEIGIQYISNPLNYLFEDELMFDTIYHCNSAGEVQRTELLINDLKKVLNK